jgi:hypothetical protein
MQRKIVGIIDIAAVNIVLTVVINDEIVQNNTGPDHHVHHFTIPPKTTSSSQDVKARLQYTGCMLYILFFCLLGGHKQFLHASCGIRDCLNETRTRRIDAIRQPIRDRVSVVIDSEINLWCFSTDCIEK